MHKLLTHYAKDLPINIPAKYLAIKTRRDQNAVASRIFNVFHPIAVPLEQPDAPLKVSHIPKGYRVVVTTRCKHARVKEPAKMSNDQQS